MSKNQPFPPPDHPAGKPAAGPVQPDSRDMDARRGHRDSPGSLDVGRHGESSKTGTTEERPHTGRSTHH